MNRSSERDVLQRQSIADKNIRFGARNNGHPDFQANRLQDVPPLTVRVAQQRDEGGTIRIVLDGFHLGRNADLVALEIDDAVMLAIAAAAMTNRQLAVIVAAVDAILRF